MRLISILIYILNEYLYFVWLTHRAYLYLITTIVYLAEKMLQNYTNEVYMLWEYENLNIFSWPPHHLARQMNMFPLALLLFQRRCPHFWYQSEHKSRVMPATVLFEIKSWGQYSNFFIITFLTFSMSTSHFRSPSWLSKHLQKRRQTFWLAFFWCMLVSLINFPLINTDDLACRPNHNNNNKTDDKINCGWTSKPQS